MKLLLENWRKYLVEGEAQHFPWLKEIEAAKDLDQKIDVLRLSGHFKRVGGGSFRAVYGPVGDPEHVLKLVYKLDPSYLQMNKDDFDTAKRYPFIFPKAYAHADDFSWVVMERTGIIKTPDEMQKVLDQSFPKEQEAILKAYQSPGGAKLFPEYLNIADPFQIMEMIMASFRSDREVNEAADTTLVTARHGRGTNKDDAAAAKLQKTLAPAARGWFAGKMAMGKTYQELSKVMHEFEIDKRELGQGNIGFDKDYNFKIIDSSVFDSS